MEGLKEEINQYHPLGHFIFELKMSIKVLYLQAENLPIMSTVTIREELQEYLKNADDRFIKLVYGMMQADKSEGLLNEYEREELDRRVARHKQGESRSYSWQEVKEGLSGR